MVTLRSINQDDLRNHNLSVIINTILRSPSALSRADLAKTTGLTKATMSLLSALLLKNKVIGEGEPGTTQTSYGRPSTPLSIAHGRWAGMGLQINTDGYGCLALDLDGTLIDSAWIDDDMREADPEKVFASLDALAKPIEGRLGEDNYKLVGSGLALPGLVTGDMQLLMARNLGWERIDLSRFALVRRLNPVAGNEARLAALSQIPGFATQRTAGGGNDLLSPTDSFLYISTDIGIGGAVVRGGTVEVGDHGFAGELGHASVDLNGPTCRCGRRGCLETYAGRRALVEAAGIASGAEAVSTWAINELYRRWQQGDDKAVEAIDRGLDAMISVIVTAINIVDVDAVILGGFWPNLGRDLAQRLQERINRLTLGRNAAPVRVLMPSLSAYPALRGAASVGLRKFIDNPLGFFDN
ncbi:ROK family protein [Bifidobacterium sp. W8116]|uniref:ROK family protein n=1 Tax=Bifidobacterium choladohabitans TaxID=2750947 RepID=A0ABS0R1U3_9BIFI|nr:ROK family protein [Bifidobacterium choladohabitans]MBI0143996.1 ROK family protein [Bifidobacterium choladohabitans]